MVPIPFLLSYRICAGQSSSFYLDGIKYLQSTYTRAIFVYSRPLVIERWLALYNQQLSAAPIHPAI
jgi:hypothetical protein